MRTHANPNTNPDSVFRPVLTALGRLAQRLRNGQDANGEVEDQRDLLETLPLSTEEFGLAVSRLANAYRFLEANEAGAARWELNAVTASLRTRAAAEAREPRPRRRKC